MNLNKLYKMQDELDKHILEKHNIKMSKEELLDSTILALLVEVGELANTTRCFKHWSTKGMMEKEIVLEELSDVWHFYLSIGNQLGYVLDNKFNTPKERMQCSKENEINKIFKAIYHWAITLEGHISYGYLGEWIKILAIKLGFTDKEVEQAYLKKHEENYRRESEGY